LICLFIYPSFFKLFFGSEKCLVSYPFRFSEKGVLVFIQSARHYYENIRRTFGHRPMPSNTFPHNFYTVHDAYVSISESRYDTQYKHVKRINTECYRKMLLFFFICISNKIKIWGHVIQKKIPIAEFHKICWLTVIRLCNNLIFVSWYISIIITVILYYTLFWKW
jgi:hypothetical protein